MNLFRRKNIDAMVTSAPGPLRKVMGATDLVMMGLAAMVGTGIFVVLGRAALSAGPGITLSFLAAGVACALAALCYAEFTAMIPVAGSTYTYAYAAIGEVVAWVTGWSLIAEYGLAASSMAVGWSGYFQTFLSTLGVHLPTALTAAPGAADGVTTFFNLPAFAIVMVATALLSLGVRESKRISNLMVLIKVAVIVLFIAVGIWHVEPTNWTPYMPMGMGGVVSGAAIVIFSFLGFDVVSSAAEEVKNPQRDLPIGLLGSLVICILLYVGVSAVATGIVPFMDFRGSDSPLALVLQRADIQWLAELVLLAAIFGMASMVMVMGYGIARLVFAISRDGLLPKFLSTVNHRQVPIWSTWLLGTCSALMAGLLPLQILTELICMGTLLAFIIIAAAIPILRRTQRHLKRPFRVPFSPFVPLLSIIISIVLICSLTQLTWIAFGIWLAVGFVIYFGYSRRHSKLRHA